MLINKEMFLAIVVAYFFSYYRNPYISNIFLLRVFQITDNFFNYMNHIMSPDNYALDNEDKDRDREDEKVQIEYKPEPKYQDKYLAEIKKIDKEFKFDEREEALILSSFVGFLSMLKENYSKKINKMKDRICEIEVKLTKYEGIGADNDYWVCEDNSDSNSDSDDSEEVKETKKVKEMKLNMLVEENNQLENDIKKIIAFLESNEGQLELVKKANEYAKQFVINQRLDNLKNCQIMEKTPLGNVIMFYNNKRESFEYYSDSTIPYRYLEPVARKYVKQFGCRAIFVDMEEELRLCEELLEKEKKYKDEKEESAKRRAEELKETVLVEEKKSVFAKFKSYNKEAGTGRVNTCAPPKNSIPNKPVTETKQNDKVLLKANANRYTYEGKISNFSFLKKVERKVVDKKYAMSFADFKKKNLENLLMK